MLLKLESITPVACDTDAFEIAILTVRYDTVMTVFWCGIHRLPTDEELKKIVSSCALAMNTSRIILHFEHVSNDVLETPTFDLIKTLVGSLLQMHKTIQKNVIGSIFQSQVLDEKTKMMRDMFLSIYKPVRPLCLTDSQAGIEDFVQQLSRLPDSQADIEDFVQQLSKRETEVCHITSSLLR